MDPLYKSAAECTYYCNKNWADLVTTSTMSCNLCSQGHIQPNSPSPSNHLCNPNSPPPENHLARYYYTCNCKAVPRYFRNSALVVTMRKNIPKSSNPSIFCRSASPLRTGYGAHWPAEIVPSPGGRVRGEATSRAMRSPHTRHGKGWSHRRWMGPIDGPAAMNGALHLWKLPFVAYTASV